MKFSSIVNNVHTQEQVADSVEDLIKIIVNRLVPTTSMWSPALFKSNYKNNQNYLGHPSLFVIDIDENLPLEECKQRCDELGFQYLLLPTRSHQKSKHGKVCDRYRVVLFLEEPINNKDVYDATWDYVVQNYFKEADPQCKDPSRGYFYSIEVYAASTTGKKIAPQQPKPKTMRKMVPTTGTSNTLLPNTVKLLIDGVGKGSRDSEVFKAAADFKRKGYDVESAVTRITNAPIEYDSTFTPDDAERKVRDVYGRQGEGYEVTSTSNDKFRTFILNGILIQDLEGDRLPTVVDTLTGMRVNVALKMLPNLIGRDSYRQYMQNNNLIAQYRYEPYQRALIFTDADTGVNILNEYQPPFWQRSNFYRGEPLPAPQKAPPEIITKFLLHLVDNDIASYEYILDWIANMLKSRNLTILTTIGDEGVGKGTLGSLLGELVGASNYVKVRSDVFKDKFNSQFENKRLVFIDEIGLSKTAEYNRFKDVVNDEIELEKKGKDARSIKNYASFFIASNDSSAIRPSPGDRRFSLINLTKTKLKDTPLRSELWKLRDKPVIEAFVGFLLSRQLKHDMMTPFKAEAKADEIAEASLPDWAHYFIYDFLEEHVGEQFETQGLALTLKLNSGCSRPPGRKKFENLAKLYPNYIKLLQVKKKRYVKIIGCPNQPSVVEYEETKESL